MPNSNITGPRILSIDFETTPNDVRTFGYYDTNVVSVQQDWYLLSAAWQWYGEEEEVHFARKSRAKGNDRALTKQIWKLFDEADVVMAYNGDRFDVKVANTRFLIHRLGMPSPYRTIDPIKMLRKHFKFVSNKASEIGRALGIEAKLSSGGIETWEGCISNDPDAWAKMEEYNKQDVRFLTSLWTTIRPYVTTPINAQVYASDEYGVLPRICPSCMSYEFVKNGNAYTSTGKRQMYRCNNCGRNFRAATKHDNGRFVQA